MKLHSFQRERNEHQEREKLLSDYRQAAIRLAQARKRVNYYAAMREDPANARVATTHYDHAAAILLQLEVDMQDMHLRALELGVKLDGDAA